MHHETLHIEIDIHAVENEIDGGIFRGQTVEDAVMEKYQTLMMSLRKDPKSHDEKFYYIHAAHGTHNGADPFSRIDPYGTGDSMTGFHDGFREEYQKVTTNSLHKIDSITAEQAFIRMMRDLRPDHAEEVIN